MEALLNTLEILKKIDADESMIKKGKLKIQAVLVKLETSITWIF